MKYMKQAPVYNSWFRTLISKWVTTWRFVRPDSTPFSYISRRSRVKKIVVYLDMLLLRLPEQPKLSAARSPERKPRSLMSTKMSVSR